MVQVFQKSEKYDAADYRIVSLTCICCRLVHSADEYNLHGAKRLFTIPNVLSASCPSVKQDGENKWFLHRLFYMEFHR